MSYELELKVKVEDHETLRMALQKADARRESAVLETNSLYDKSDRSLRTSGCGLRMRHCRPLTDEDHAPEPTMTFKGPVQAGPFKNREEIEFAVSDADAANRMLTALGYELTLGFEKRRETWRIDQCTIELDEIPHLGRYVEIEGPDETAIHNVASTLGIDPSASIKTSYVALLARHCEEINLPPTSITFDTA